VIQLFGTRLILHIVGPNDSLNAAHVQGEQVNLLRASELTHVQSLGRTALFGQNTRCAPVTFPLFAWKCVGAGLLVAAEVLVARPAQLSQVSYGRLLSDLTVMLLSSHFAHQANVGAAVLLVWLATWASGRCRPEPSWVDGSGCVLGAGWVCISP